MDSVAEQAGASLIRLWERQAYGFWDHEFSKLKILAIHEAKYALVG